MTFLEARKILAEFKGGDKIPFLLAMSGTPDQLVVFVRAQAALLGVEAQPSALPFGTLGQHLFSEKNARELILLMPWDLAPECDWRLGLGATPSDIQTILSSAESVAKLLSTRKNARLAYLPAPIPPLFSSYTDNVRIGIELSALAVRLGAVMLDPKLFSMATYFSNGAPMDGTALPIAAEVLVDLLFEPAGGRLKVLATDADNTLWRGLVGEDGADGVSAEPNGLSYRHFVYQGYLLKLKRAGILLAIVSRNDKDLVQAALNRGLMPLKVDDFVSTMTGYGSKSDLLRVLAEDLNLSKNSIVFVDDNPVELAEVASALPEVTCQAFPSRDEDLSEFLNRIARLFDRLSVTPEDLERTELYQRKRKTQPPPTGVGIRDFLKGLEMVLSPRDCTSGDWTRASQLINKTNQFNLNGLRLDESKIDSVIGAGGRMFAAALEDRSGSHGEILACLVASDGQVLALVMSCRVFQRKVEYAFLHWLLSQWNGPELTFNFVATDRNEPMRNFLSEPAFSEGAKNWTLDRKAFEAVHHDDIALFTIREVRQ